MSLSQQFLKFIAARFHVPPDALDYFFAAAHIGHGAETRYPYPAELVPIGARLVLRGWLNHKFFPAHLDWILPYWAQEQFDPHTRSFIPYGFDLYTLNYSHRDWTMVGNLGRSREAIVDPRGLITPWYDGWSLDVWVEINGKLFTPSRLLAVDVAQSLHENLPIVITKYRAGDVEVELEAFAAESAEHEWAVDNLTVTNRSAGANRVIVYLAFRPFNPEGVSLIKEIECRVPSDDKAKPPVETNKAAASPPERKPVSGMTAVLINSALAAIIPTPSTFAASTLERGDIAQQLSKNSGTPLASDASGLVTAVAAYQIELASYERKTISALMPLTREDIQVDDPCPFAHIRLPSSADLRLQTISRWRDKLSEGMRVELPDEQLSNAFDANKAYLLLLYDGNTITPGPFTYHQFWMRDSAYLLDALDKLGFHQETRAVIEKIFKRLQKDGYLRATEGEWDSNGAAIWTMVEHARLSGDNDLLYSQYWMLLRMASWINSKRQMTKDGKQMKTNDPSSVLGQQSPQYGLLPSGPSAEHLGPADYYYWDDFWGLAGLRDAGRAAELLGQKEDAQKLLANFKAFRADVDASLVAVEARLGRKAMPASPGRPLDAGMIGSIAAAYPLHLFDAQDDRIVDTIAALKEFAWMEDAYFNHVGHAALGTYLSLHVAQCLLMQRDAAAWKIINWVLQHTSPTFTWAEGINPVTRHGGMGDGHHGWAAADFIQAVRNALLMEEEDHLVITPILPQAWAAENNIVKVDHAATYFGDVSYTIAFGERNATLVVRPNWRNVPEYIEWCLPFKPIQAGDDAEIIGQTVRLPRGSAQTIVTW